MKIPIWWFEDKRHTYSSFKNCRFKMGTVEAFSSYALNLQCTNRWTIRTGFSISRTPKRNASSLTLTYKDNNCFNKHFVLGTIKQIRLICPYFSFIGWTVNVAYRMEHFSEPPDRPCRIEAMAVFIATLICQSVTGRYQRTVLMSSLGTANRYVCQQ